jgi:hypothetical protein
MKSRLFSSIVLVGAQMTGGAAVTVVATTALDGCGSDMSANNNYDASWNNIHDITELDAGIPEAWAIIDEPSLDLGPRPEAATPTPDVGTLDAGTSESGTSDAVAHDK